MNEWMTHLSCLLCKRSTVMHGFSPSTRSPAWMCRISVARQDCHQDLSHAGVQ